MFAAGLLTWTAGPLVVLLRRADRGDTIVGATGPFAGDQLQYAAWMRSAADHAGRVANLYDLGDPDPVFVHPMAAISGALVAAGASVPLALLVWAPVAAAALGLGVWRFAVRHVDGPTWAVWVAAGLGLWFASPVPWLHDLVGAPGGDRWSGQDAVGLTPSVQLWGYYPAAVAIGLVALCLLGVERVLDAEGGGRRGRRLAWAVAAGAALAGWLHPWEGALLVIAMAILSGWSGRAGLRRAALPIVGAALPLAYYAVLPVVSDDWEVARAAQRGAPRPLLAAVLALLPLAAIAAPALSRIRRPVPPGDRTLLAWLVAVAVLFITVPAFPLHALTTATIPLSVLAARTLASWRPRAPAAAVTIAAVVLLVVPGQRDLIRFEHDQLRSDAQPFILSRSERDALSFLEHAPVDGGVIARVHLGTAIPAFTGRQTWVGHPFWTPSFIERATAADAVLRGSPTPEQADLVGAAGARFLLARCGEGTSLAPPVVDLVVGRHRFGCVTVYELANRSGSP